MGRRGKKGRKGKGDKGIEMKLMIVVETNKQKNNENILSITKI